MNILDVSYKFFLAENIICSERIKIFELRFSIKKEKLPDFNVILEYLNLYEKRDNISITITNPDDEFLVVNLSTERDNFNKYVANLADEDILDIYIVAQKNIKNNKLTVYNFNEFIKDLLSNDMYSIILLFGNLIKKLDYLVFDVKDETMFWCTKTLAFSSDERIIFYPKLNRIERLETCKKTCYVYSEKPIDLIPDDFNIITDYNNNVCSEIFKRISTLLSFIYISSIVSVNANEVNSQINGHRHLSFRYMIDEIVYNNELYKIYDWIYTDGNPIDKSIIAHNVISLHCKMSDIIKIDEKTFLSIISNYQLYLKENATQYLELKNKISEYICDFTSKIGGNVTALLADFKKNLIAVFGFILSIVLVNIGSSQPLNNILSYEITALLEMIILGSFVYFIICLFETIYNYKKHREAYYALKKNYQDIFQKNELERLFDNDNVFNKSHKAVLKGIIIYSIIWLLFFIISFIVIESISDYPFVSPIIESIKDIITNFISRGEP